MPEPPWGDILLIAPATLESAALRRLVAEVQAAVQDEAVPAPVHAYARVHNRHNLEPGPWPGGDGWANVDIIKDGRRWRGRICMD